MFARLANLRDQGFVPSRILDVGANRGLWTKAVRQIWPRAQLLMFEANPNLVPELEGSGAPFRIAVLGETARDVTMHFGRGKSITGSSMFRESGKHSDNFDATTCGKRGARTRQIKQSVRGPRHARFWHIY